MFHPCLVVFVIDWSFVATRRLVGVAKDSLVHIEVRVLNTCWAIFQAEGAFIVGTISNCLFAVSTLLY